MHSPQTCNHMDAYIYLHIVCLPFSPSLSATGRCASLHQVQLNLCPQSIGGQSVIRTSKSWMSVRAGLMPCWGRIKGPIDKCDMLIQGQIEEKIPLSGHEGTPCGTSFRGGCHLSSRTSTVDLASNRKEMMVMRCFCLWTLFMTVMPWSRLNRGNFLLKIVVFRQFSVPEMWSLLFSWLTLSHITKSVICSQCSDQLKKSVWGECID